MLRVISRGFSKIQSIPNIASNLKYSYDQHTPILNDEFDSMMNACNIHKTAHEKYIIALSGGPDSMALLHLMKEWASPSRLIAVTIDHGFRPESTDEADRVHDWANAVDVNHMVKKIDWKSINGDTPSHTQLETMGREERYRLLDEVCKQYQIKTIVLAHHGDDQIETFLMRLYRGSGISGLACMRSIQEMDDGTRLLRPLLTLSKQRLLATCKARSIPYVIDPSNDDMQYDRNRVRHGLSLLQQSDEMDISSILGVISFFQTMRDMTDTETSMVLHSCCEYNRILGICRINISSLSCYRIQTIVNVVREIFCATSGVTSPSEKAINRIAKTISTGQVERPMQAAGCVIAELKIGSSVYLKQGSKDHWISVSIDRNQLSHKSIRANAVELPLNQGISYMKQYNVKAVIKQIDQTRLKTVKSFPFLSTFDPIKNPLQISFLSDQMLQQILCSNRGLLVRQNLNETVARSLPVVFAEIAGELEVVYSPVLKINRISSIDFMISPCVRRIFSNCHPWIIN